MATAGVAPAALDGEGLMTWGKAIVATAKMGRLAIVLSAVSSCGGSDSAPAAPADAGAQQDVVVEGTQGGAAGSGGQGGSAGSGGMAGEGGVLPDLAGLQRGRGRHALHAHGRGALLAGHDFLHVADDDGPIGE